MSGAAEAQLLAHQVRAERLQALQAKALLPILVGAAFCLLPVLGLWQQLPQGLLLGWLALRWAISAWRCAEGLRFARRSLLGAGLVRQERRFLWSLAVDGLSWGLMGVIFHLPGMPELDWAMLAILVGVCAVGLLSLGSWTLAHSLFSLLTLTPLLLHLVWLGQSQLWLGAIGLLCFLLVGLVESRRTQAHTLELLRLRFEQAQLAEQSRLALHAAEETSSSKSRFVAVMSHEIRTPLNGILGMTQLLERSELNAQQREQVDIVRRSGRHLLALVNDILDLARMESGKLVVDAHPVELREVAGDVCRLLGETARAKGLQFELRIASGLPTRVMGDASRIQQVLHNLVGNAIKFTESGAVTVEVSTVLDMRAGTLLRLAVQDSGEGIAADQLERIFAPFEQAGAAHARRRDGTGLGLTISRELARAMGGDLRCASSPGQGSVFEFTLPLQACPEPAAEPPRPVAAISQPLPQLQGRVLLVDDSAVNLLVASSMLERCGLQVDQADNGREALRRLQGQAYGLVLMDCQMPEMDGFAATQAWRHHEAAEGLARTPIVALTASAVGGDHHRCLDVGMDGYLVKPFEMDELLQVVQRHLRPNADNAAPCMSSAASNIPASPQPAR
jgi:signal transduction histidine kinase/CheY-like chemotaxis protein